MINFLILVEDCDTGGPSSMTVRMENLFGFQSSYCELYVEVRNIILLIFVLLACFNCRWVRVEAESLNPWGQLKSHISVPIFSNKLVGLNPKARVKYLAIQPLLATA